MPAIEKPLAWRTVGNRYQEIPALLGGVAFHLGQTARNEVAQGVDRRRLARTT
jgi:hypothetical protein